MRMAAQTWRHVFVLDVEMSQTLFSMNHPARRKASGTGRVLKDSSRRCRAVMSPMPLFCWAPMEDRETARKSRFFWKRATTNYRNPSTFD
jgi:hypothetical protein